jgi:hypothetical protein
VNRGFIEVVERVQTMGERDEREREGGGRVGREGEGCGR